MTVRASLLVSAPALALMVTGCGASGVADNRADGAVEAHARTAGVVMHRGYGPVPAKYAAARVAGQVGDTTIDALEARGSTWSGLVVLRISVTDYSENIGASHSERCFEYRFQRPQPSDQPKRLDHCPSRPALVLPDPTSLPRVDQHTRNAIDVALQALPSQDRDDPNSVRSALRTRLGPEYQLEVSREAAGVALRVMSDDECITGTVAPGSVTLGRPLQGTACFD